jgi:ATP-binding cassette subfamily F protein uup
MPICKREQREITLPLKGGVPTGGGGSSDKKRKLTFNEKREYEQLTKDIESLEKEKAELESALASGTLSNDELITKSQRFQEVTNLLDEKEFRWLELDELN